MESIKTLFTYKNMFILLSLIAFMCFVNAGWCGTTSGSDLPWESGVDKIKKSITGPIATGICILGVVGCGAGLIVGGDMGQLTQKTLMVVMVICLIVGATKFIMAITDSGALLPFENTAYSQELQKNSTLLNNSKHCVFGVEHNYCY